MLANPLDPSRYYRPSNRVSFTGLLIASLVGVVMAAVLVGLYALVSAAVGAWGSGFWVFAWNVGAPLLMSALVFVAVHLLNDAAKVRLRPVGCLLGFGFGLLTWYGMWVAWVYLNAPSAPLILHPGELAAFILHEGSALSYAPAVPWLFWAVEGLLVVAVAAWIGLGGANDPFCESCQQWVCSEPATTFELQPLPLDSLDLARVSFEKGDFSRLTKLAVADDPEMAVTTVRLSRCDGCKDVAFLSVQVTTTGVVEEVVRDLIVHPRQHGRLLKELRDVRRGFGAKDGVAVP